MKKTMMIGMMMLGGALTAALQPGARLAPPQQTGGARPPHPGMAQRGAVQGAHKARPQRTRRGDGERMSETEKRLDYLSKLEEKGRHALPQIASYIIDRDEEVSEEAFSIWSRMVEEMDYQLRANAILQAADAIRQAGHQH